MSVSWFDIMIMPVWLLASGVLVRAAWRLSRVMFSTDAMLQHAVHTIVLAWAGIVLPAFALGSLGVLTPLSLMAIVVAEAGFVLRFARPRAERRAKSDGALWTWLWGAWLAMWAGSVIVGGLLEYPSDFDSMMYHIPLVDQWLQARSLYAPDATMWYNPSNNELIELWIVGPFSGDFLVSLSNLPAATLFGLGTVELGRGVALRMPTAQLAGFAAVANFVVSRQLTDNENDVAVAGLFVATLGYAFRHVRDADRGSLALACISSGLLAGVKYYALGYAAIVVAATIVLAALRGGRRGAVRGAGMAIVGLSLFGAYWYLRNAWVTGQPIFPRALFARSDVFSEVYTNVWQTTLFGNGRPEVVPLLISALRRSMGPASLIVCAAAPVTVSWLLWSGAFHARDPKRLASAAARLALAATLAASVLVFGITPFTVETDLGTMNQLRWGYLPARFGLCPLTLSLLCLLVVTDDVCDAIASCGHRHSQPRSQPWRVRGAEWKRVPFWIYAVPRLILAALLVAQLMPAHTRRLPGDRLDALIVGFDIALFAGLVAAWLRTRAPWRSAALCVLLSVGFSLAAGWLGTRWHNGFARHYDMFFSTTVFTHLAKHPPTNHRICSLEFRCYPFFGSHRETRVSRPMLTPSFGSLLAYIEAHGATMVVSLSAADTRMNRRYHHVRAWLDANPDRLRLLMADSVFSLYELSDSATRDAVVFDDRRGGAKP